MAIPEFLMKLFGFYTAISWKFLKGEPKPPLTQNYLRPSFKLVALRQLLICVFRVTKTIASTQAPPKNQNGIDLPFDMLTMNISKASYMIIHTYGSAWCSLYKSVSQV
ncbi:hypothetical protein RF11_15492 [Thelohanellus kitauei]|uniref:Uncharacterized protein n=1 Tax=Thelohanellus kitauei TaxID=669202 RepID=A0A0C2J8E2_THEKT|nr:hypothetical protein RF11_15492 [Thelohanellus kitauei]